MKNYDDLTEGETIIARVTVKGSINPRAEAWSFSAYRVKKSTKSGYVFAGRVTGTFFPSKFNSEYCEQLVKTWNLPTVFGRPDKNTIIK